MKKRKPSKIPLIIMILAIQLPLMGAGWFAIGLRNVDSKNPLVKIDALIGGSGMPDPSKIPQTEQEEIEDENTDAEDVIEDEKDEPKVVISTEIKVKVRGRTILINDGMTPESYFETRIAELYDKSKQVIIIDDYADYQIYSKVKKYFEDNEIKVKEETSK